MERGGRGGRGGGGRGRGFKYALWIVLVLFFSVLTYVIIHATMAVGENKAHEAVTETTGGFAEIFPKAVTTEQPGKSITPTLGNGEVLPMVDVKKKAPQTVTQTTGGSGDDFSKVVPAEQPDKCAEVVSRADDEKDAPWSIAQATGSFANNFLKVVANEQSGNLIMSPLSAQVVLAMAAYGAGGCTATQMRSTLLLPSDNELGQSGYQSLIQTLNAVKGVELRLANKIYTGTQFTIKDAYKQLTTNKFLSTSQELDFNDATAAANTINGWCAEQTNNLIKDVITPDMIGRDTKLVLVNAVYFKGQWAIKFDPRETHDGPFQVNALITKYVPFMAQHHAFRFGFLDQINAECIELPYKGEELSMIIILPNQTDGLKKVLDNLHQVNLTNVSHGLWIKKMLVYLPKFKIETTLDLKDTLEKMGMTDMFQGSANFSGITGTPLKVSKVIQKAFIEVNEEGTKAAAFSVVEPSFLILDADRRPKFIIDRPFVYVIMHRSSHVPLFSGKILDPTQK